MRESCVRSPAVLPQVRLEASHFTGELLWTDPQEVPGRGPSKRVSSSALEHLLANFHKGVGIAFGPDVTRRWCELNGVTGVLRSHEVRMGRWSHLAHMSLANVSIFRRLCYRAQRSVYNRFLGTQLCGPDGQQGRFCTYLFGFCVDQTVVEASVRFA